MNKQAFTLIELLVVVLIIGILAAVALPQYNKAVEKSRIRSIMPILKTIAQANEVYYLANDNFSSNIRDLDVQPGGCTELTGEALGDLKQGQLWKCGNDFLVDNSVGSKVRVYAHYCPGHNDTWAECEANRDFQIYIQIYANNTLQQKWGCWSFGTTMGDRACAIMETL